MTFGWLMLAGSAILLFLGWLLVSTARGLAALRRAAPRLKVLEGTVVGVHTSVGSGPPASPGNPSLLAGKASHSIDVRFTTPAGVEVTFRGGTGTPYLPAVGNPVDVLFDPEGKLEPALKRDLGASPGFPLAAGILLLVLALLALSIAFGVLTGRLQTGV